nr:HWE histidine kinase domain-containing protein [uncultured Sphingomonas sp.]
MHGQDCHEPDCVTRDKVFEAVARNAIDAIFVLDRHGRVTFANRAAEEMFGWSQAEFRSQRLHDLIHSKRTDGSSYPISDCPLNAVFESGRSLRLHDDVFFHRNGRAVAVTCTNGPIQDRGEIVGGLLIVRDETERRLIEEQNELLRRELNHRVKNNLTLIQAIIHKTLRAVTPADTLRALDARLDTLASANQLLVEEAWAFAKVSSVVQRSLAPFAQSDRIEAEGPNIDVQPSAAVAMALTLHELATNAVKYGSLATDLGSVRVNWKFDHENNFELIWTEKGGSPPEVEKRRGFGTDLMRRVWQGLSGSGRLRYLEQGLKATFCAPRDRIEAFETHEGSGER